MPEKYKQYYLSREQNKDALILTQKSMDMFDGERARPTLHQTLTCHAENYKSEPHSVLRSPLLFESHKGLPPTYFQVCGADPLRDEGLIYESLLREECDVPTRLDVFPGLPHAFWTWFPKAKFSEDFQDKTIGGLKWLLEQVRAT